MDREVTLTELKSLLSVSETLYTDLFSSATPVSIIIQSKGYDPLLCGKVMFQKQTFSG